jgi:hypothetical protein
MITLLFTVLSALYDKGKRFQDHAGRFVFRGIVIGLISFFEMPVIIIGMYKPTLLQFLLNISIFYLVFDYLINILEGRKWNYIGTTSEIDKLWHKLGGWFAQLIFKIIFFLTLIYIKCQTL